MRERVREIFTSLPPEGVAIHGTNLARAQRIRDEGLIPQNLHPNIPLNKTYYFLQSPNLNIAYSRIHMRMLKIKIDEALAPYANRAAQRSLYWISDAPENRIPALVVFKPLQKVDASTTVNPALPWPLAAYEDKPIPKDNVYGIIPVPLNLGAGKIIMETLAILQEKGVINSVKLPQLQEA